MRHRYSLPLPARYSLQPTAYSLQPTAYTVHVTPLLLLSRVSGAKHLVRGDALRVARYIKLFAFRRYIYAFSG